MPQPKPPQGPSIVCGSRRKFLIQGQVVGAAALTGLPALLLGLNGNARAAGKPIPVGQAGPTTDFAAPDGIEFRNGLTMACEEINALGGILGRPLEPFFQDTAQMGDAVITQAAQRLIDRHDVHAIINGYNIGSGVATQEVVADSEIIYVHYDTVIAHNHLVKSNPKRYWGSFQGDPAEFWYGPGMLNFMRSLEASGGWKRSNNKLAIILSAGTYSSNIANALKAQAAQYGWQVSLFETVSVPVSEWGPTLAKLRKDPPGAIAVTHFLPADLAQFMLQFTPNPTKSLIYMQYGPSIPAFRDIAKQAANGVLFSTVVGALSDEKGSAYEARYKKRFGPNAGHHSGAQPYDGCFVWATAAAKAGGSAGPGNGKQNKLVADQMRQLVWRGVCGTTRFMPDEQSAYSYPNQVKDPSLGMPHQFLQIQDHTKGPTLIAPDPFARGKFVMPPWMKG